MLITLGQLAGQLGGFVGQSDVVKKAVIYAIVAHINSTAELKNDLEDVYSSHVTTLSDSVKSAVQAVGTDEIGPLKKKVYDEIRLTEEQINNLKTHNNLLPSPSSSAESDKLQSKLEALRKVQKLCEFYDKFKSASNNPNNILNNLCSGLEKFLGFNKDSKGYDGQGIVYSDLDRLCDGVMGFLSGVLSAVKNENEVTTYDKYITKNLKSVLEEVNKKIGSGRTGLAVSVEQVKEWLEGYESELNKKTDNVTKHLDTLSRNIETNINSIKNINTSPSHFETEVAQWSSKVVGALDETLKCAESAIRELDKPLQIKVANDSNSIALSITHLKANAERDEKQMKALGRKMYSRLEKAKISIIHVIQEKIEELEGTLHGTILVVKDELEAINAKLKSQTYELDRWISTAAEIVYKAIRQANNILSKVKDNDSEQTSIKRSASKLNKDAQALYNAMTAAHGYISERVGKALGAVRDMDAAVQADLAALRQAIKEKVGAYAATVPDFIGKSIKALTNVIAEGGEDEHVGRFEGLLYEIENGVGSYAQNFTKRNFADKILSVWIRNILESEPVKTQISWYIAGTKSRFETPYGANGKLTDMQLTAKLARQIMSELDGKVIAEAQSKIVAVDDGKIEKYVEAIHSVCDKFGDELSKKIRTIKVETIASLIDTEFVATSSRTSNSDPNGYLEWAIRYMLHQLLGIARQTGIALRSFALEKWSGSNTLAKNVEVAIAKVKRLAHDLADRLKGNGALGINAGEGKDFSDALRKAFDKKMVDDFGAEHDTLQLTSVYMGVYNGDTGKQAVTTPINNIKDLPDGLGKIASVMDEQNTPITISTLESLYGTVALELGELEKLVVDSSKHSGVLDALLNLQRRIGEEKINKVNGLAKIEQEFYQIMGTDSKRGQISLAKSIHDASIILKITLRNGVKECIATIQDTCRTEINAAVDDIKRDALQRYVKLTLPVLNDLRDRIHTLVVSIKVAISRDVKSGVKGLLKTMNNNKTTLDSSYNVNNIAPVAANTNLFGTKLTDYVNTQIKASADSPLTVLRNALNKMLNNIVHAEYPHFDYAFVILREKLENEITTLTSALDPQALPDAGRPVLRALREGMLGFVGELGKAYINKYSMETFKEALTEMKDEKDTLTEYGRKCAKVCLSIVPMVSADMKVIYEKCNIGGDWTTERINMNTNLGEFLAQRGYKVSTKKDSHDGALRNKDECVGVKIKEFMNKLLDTAAMNNLTDCLRSYYYVCHLRVTPSPKTPTTVCQMLKWCAGLRYNAMLNKVEDYTKTLFSKPKNQENSDYRDISVSDLQLVGTSTITPRDLCDTIYDVCRYAKTILIAILGHGHNDGVYACDFSANEDGFSYPVNPADCFDTLVDMLYRLHDQLYFLYLQCYRNSKNNSWRDCWYGRGIGGSSWECNELQCANQICNQIADQKRDQIHNQIGDQHPKCGVKSPLQSFLEDGLPGFIPHTFDKVGCKLECTVSKHRGLLCKTPMGFADISNVASHTKQGAHLTKVLYDFCGHMDSPLVKLCGNLVCVLNRPPQTLSDMYAFYYNLLHDWNGKSKGAVDVRKHKMTAFNDAVTRANFGVPYPELNVNSIITDHKSNNHTTGDLLCLYSCNSTSSLTATCGRYLHPFSMNTWTTFSEKHADKYLSWIVYITEVFYSLLEQLLKECCQNCTSTQSRCNGKVCPKTCPVKYTSEETQSQSVANLNHTKDCKSIAYCPLTRPTLCKYGFVFKSLSNMSGTSGDVTKRTCKDLCHALQNVLLKGKVLGEFTHVTIPKFLWNIRSKFFWTTVALWLLSLFYLICVMVGRLDVLHIRSHLRSPSSHRITAQSLLAAAQVGRLAKISYLQP